MQPVWPARVSSSRTGVGSELNSNPWPFETEFLLDKPLPAQAHWHTEGWQGTMLPYAALVDEPNAEEHLLAYARAVYELARPTLLEGWK